MTLETTKDKLFLLPILKGAPMSILFALHFSSTPMSNLKLRRATKYSDKTIAAGVETLKDLGLLRRQSARWILVGDFFEVGNFPTHESEYFPPDGNSPSTTTAINYPHEINKSAVAEETSRRNSALIALHKGGIHNPKAQELAELKHATPEFINAHVEYGKQNREGIGLVITRVENGESVPVKGSSHYGKDNSQKPVMRGKAVEEMIDRDFINRK